MQFSQLSRTMILSGAMLLAPVTFAASDEYAMSYSTAELETYDGVKAVHERINKAARQYCPTYSQIRSHADVRTCVDGVVDDLVAKIAHPQLTYFHEEDGAFKIARVRRQDPDNS